jgi:DNA 3'-phosphatase
VGRVCAGEVEGVGSGRVSEIIVILKSVVISHVIVYTSLSRLGFHLRFLSVSSPRMPSFPIRYRSSAVLRWMVVRLTVTCRYQVVLLSNQGAVNLRNDQKTVKADQKNLSNFKARVLSVFRQLDVPVSIYAATDKDEFRKPRVGMWKTMLGDYGLDISEGIDFANSFFVGDAAGREAVKGRAKDFSCSDRLVRLEMRDALIS